MKLETLSLDAHAQGYFVARGVAESVCARISVLAPASFAWLLDLVVPHRLMPSNQVPAKHWSGQGECYGPNYYQRRMAAGNPPDSRKWEDNCRADVTKFFTKAFRFGGVDEVYLVNVRSTYLTDWTTFLSTWEAFTPFHDIIIIVRRNDDQFGVMTEDADSVWRGTRPELPGFDTESFLHRRAAIGG